MVTELKVIQKYNLIINSMKRLRKRLIVAFLILSGFSMVKGGEVEKFITETLEEQRMRNTQKGGTAPEIINEAVSDIELPEYELPKQSIFTAKDRERDARYYSYDKSGRLTKVEYAASPKAWVWDGLASIFFELRANDLSDTSGKTYKIGDIFVENMLDFIKRYLDGLWT